MEYRSILISLVNWGFSLWYHWFITWILLCMFIFIPILSQWGSYAGGSAKRALPAVYNFAFEANAVLNTPGTDQHVNLPGSSSFNIKEFIHLSTLWNALWWWAISCFLSSYPPHHHLCFENCWTNYWLYFFFFLFFSLLVYYYVFLIIITKENKKLKQKWHWTWSEQTRDNKKKKTDKNKNEQKKKKKKGKRKDKDKD